MATQALDRFHIPDHVPPELVLPVQIAEGDEFLAAPHAYMARLHEWCPPVFYRTTPQAGGGCWTLIKHEDALFMLRHPELFHNRAATPFPREEDFKFIPIEIDPPDHRKYRNILDPLFSPQGVAKLEATIRQRANDLIDRFVGDRKTGGECEFTTAFDRPRKTILAFTVGVHSCMGAHLARLEITVALQEWLRRIPDFALKPGAEIVYRPGGVIGPKKLPLIW